jgi:nucleoside transporter
MNRIRVVFLGTDLRGDMSTSAAPLPWIKSRLSVQMFLQFAIWGSWAPVLGVHLTNIGFEPSQIGDIYGTAALATILAPMLAGQIADRWVATEKFLAFSFIVSGVLLFLASRVGAEDPAKVSKLWWYAFGAMLFFGPSLGLANSLSFSHMSDPAKDFPVVRMAGTIGWIAAGLTVTVWMKASPTRPMGDCLVIGAIYSVLNGIYCLTLPHTPPKKAGVEMFAAAKAFRMLKDPSFALLLVLAFVLLIFATVYYSFGSMFFANVGISQSNIPTVMAIGQFAEILTMLVLPWMFRILGSKRTIALGVLFWAVRFALFALGRPLELMYVAQAMHGACFAFAIAGAMIYVEKVSPADIRASTQSLLSLATYGLGMMVGSWVGGALTQSAKVDDVIQWGRVWWIASAGCAAVLVVFLAGFKARDAAPADAAAPPAA